MSFNVYNALAFNRAIRSTSVKNSSRSASAIAPAYDSFLRVSESVVDDQLPQPTLRALLVRPPITLRRESMIVQGRLPLSLTKMYAASVIDPQLTASE